MNLNTINNRIDKLELKSPARDGVTLLCYNAIPPVKTDTGMQQGVPNKGIACSVVSGATFSRENYTSKQDYINAVNQEHIRVHGKPCDDFEVSE